MTYCERNHPVFSLADLKSYFSGDLGTYQSGQKLKSGGFVASTYPVQSASSKDQIKVKLGYICPKNGCV